MEWKWHPTAGPYLGTQALRETGEVGGPGGDPGVGRELTLAGAGRTSTPLIPVREMLFLFSR